jgi:hypothetical protein
VRYLFPQLANYPVPLSFPEPLPNFSELFSLVRRVWQEGFQLFVIQIVPALRAVAGRHLPPAGVGWPALVIPDGVHLEKIGQL